MAEQVRYGEGLYLQKGIRLFASVLSAAISGMEVCPVQVEADVSSGLPCFTMVGFPSTQVKEAQDRVRTALKNNGISLPPKKVICEKKGLVLTCLWQQQCWQHRDL